MRKNAKFNRNALRGLLVALALGGLQVAHAGYAQLANPEGFAGSAGKWTYAANAANDKVYGKVIHSSGSLTTTVGGQAVKMPAAYRLAANAPRIAAAVIFAHPGLRAAIGIATWLGIGKVVWDVANNRWARLEDMEPVSGGLWMSPVSNKGYTSALAACQADYPYVKEARVYPGGGIADCFGNGGMVNTVYLEKDTTFKCPANTRTTDAGCIGQGIEQPEFIESLDPEKMPATVPLELPYPTPLPIEEPSPWINPAPGPSPDHQPRRVPTGQPEPVPNTNPQKYRQPYIDIIPAPLPDNPWRVDIKPGETTSTNPNPAENPNPDGDDKPAEEQDKSLCEKHPDILACQKPDLDTPDGEIPRTSKTVTYAEEGGFGGGSCPGNLYSNVGGKSIMVYNWSETCGVVSTYLRPIILLLGAMGALFILIPGRDS